MFKSDCEHISNLIPLYIDNMLSEKENDIVCEHIKGCPKCDEDLKFFKSMLKTAAHIPEISVPKDFHDNLMAKVKASVVSGQRKKSVRLRRAFTSFAAAAAIIALSVTAHINMPDFEQSQNPDDFVSASPKATYTEPTDENIVNDNDVINEAESTPVPSIEVEKETRIVQSSKTTPKPKIMQREYTEITVPPAEENRSVETNNTPQETNANEVAKTEDIPAPASTHGGAEVELFSEPAPAANNDDNGTVYSRMRSFYIIEVTVNESDFPQAEEILSICEKDDIGYKLPEDSSDVIDRLSALESYTSTATPDESIENDYIVLNK